jgi:hypothetical protein
MDNQSEMFKILADRVIRAKKLHPDNDITLEERFQFAFMELQEVSDALSATDLEQAVYEYYDVMAVCFRAIEELEAFLKKI